MKKNVGGIDRLIRILAGVALILWAVLGGPIWAWIGLLPLATGALSWCPAYSQVGIKTCPRK